MFRKASATTGWAAGISSVSERMLAMLSSRTKLVTSVAIPASGDKIEGMPIRERRERDGARRQQLIVTAAGERAEEEGWDAVRTRRLAERVEYSQPVLYSHFTGKAAIVRAVALEGFDDLAAELRSARTAADSPV